MTNKHTPGPWRVSVDMRGLGNVPVAGVETVEGFSIANCGTHGEANASLIASAPDLLEALQAMLDADDAICNNIGRGVDQAMARIAAIDSARAVIARATGAA